MQNSIPVSTSYNSTHRLTFTKTILKAWIRHVLFPANVCMYMCVCMYSSTYTPLSQIRSSVNVDDAAMVVFACIYRRVNDKINSTIAIVNLIKGEGATERGVDWQNRLLIALAPYRIINTIERLALFVCEE